MDTKKDEATGTADAFQKQFARYLLAVAVICVGAKLSILYLGADAQIVRWTNAICGLASVLRGAQYFEKSFDAQLKNNVQEALTTMKESVLYAWVGVIFILSALAF